MKILLIQICCFVLFCILVHIYKKRSAEPKRRSEYPGKLIINAHWEHKDGVCRYVPERTLYNPYNCFVIHGNGWTWSRFECDYDEPELSKDTYPYNDNSEAVTFEDLKKCSPQYKDDELVYCEFCGMLDEYCNCFKSRLL